MATTEAPGFGSTPPRRESTRRARLAVFDDAVAILNREFARPIRIEEVARRVSVSPRQLQRVFSEHGELGFRSYLRRIRMSHAHRLLTTTDVPVRQVARRVGYGDPSQFSKAFRSAYGVTPSKVREAMFSTPPLARSDGSSERPKSTNGDRPTQAGRDSRDDPHPDRW